MTSPGAPQLGWLHRSLAPGLEPDLQLEAVRALDLPSGEGRAFVHGPAEFGVIIGARRLDG